MSKIYYELICQNDKTELREELRRQLSRRFYKNLKHQKAQYFVNNKQTQLYMIINKDDKILIEYEPTTSENWPLYESKLDILYEDEHYLVVNKRAGLLTIPTKAEPRSLYQEAMYYLKQSNQDKQVSIINRLDKETSGLVVIAKDRLAAYYLQPTHEKMIRKYKCLCHGIFIKDHDIIQNNIDKMPESNLRYVSSNSGKISISEYNVLKRFSDTTLVEFILQTGRTHQIRVHCQSICHPIVGDNMYGIDNNMKLHLCSYYVEFVNKFTNKLVKISIESGWENGRDE